MKLYDSEVFGLAIIKRIGLSVVVLLLCVMWVYAFFLSPRESINRVGDRQWSSRAESVCRAARLDILALSDMRRIKSSADLMVRADLVDRATSLLERMLNEVFTVQPTDPKGLAISALWREDYKIYLNDRREYISILRRGENPPFAESRTDGIPVSEKLGTFARANDMDSCAPPIDLSV
jgi:hypothetical protein